jgi:hypothetical protein
VWYSRRRLQGELDPEGGRREAPPRYLHLRPEASTWFKVRNRNYAQWVLPHKAFASVTGTLPPSQDGRCAGWLATAAACAT